MKCNKEKIGIEKKLHTQQRCHEERNFFIHFRTHVYIISINSISQLYSIKIQLGIVNNGNFSTVNQTKQKIENERNENKQNKPGAQIRN